jgi:MFS family permease
MPATLRSQLGLLAALQALLLTNNVALTAINGLAGASVSDNRALATLPVTGYVLGGAVWAMPAAAIANRYGRRTAYTIGALVAALAALLAWFAIGQRSLALLCLATFVGGLFNAAGASLRFAAADVADAHRPTFRARAISLVLAAGIVGGFVGPEIAKWARDLLPSRFAGTYLTLFGFALVSLALAQFVRLPPLAGAHHADRGRELREIIAQPACWGAIAIGAIGYGVMNLLMVATPLAMDVCGQPFSAVATVIQWHVVGMFAPGLVTGSLLTRVGALPVIVAGCVLMLACAAIALSGIEVAHFFTALLLLGVGWNFMFTGATILLTSTYRPAERTRVQGFMDSCVFSTMILSSAASGVLLDTRGWALLNLVSVVLVAVALAIAVFVARRQGWRAGVSPARA